MSLNEKLKSYQNQFTPQYPQELEEIDYTKIPFLKKGQRWNTHISEEKLRLIPEKLRRYWYRLDLSYLDVEPPKFPEKDPISKMTETPPDIFELIKDKDKRIKLKSTIIGELDNETLDKMKNSF